MFTKINPQSDTQLSNTDVANLVFADALEKMAQLTGLSQEQGFRLLQQQFSPKNSTHMQVPVLDHNESNFIAGLFN